MKHLARILCLVLALNLMMGSALGEKPSASTITNPNTAVIVDLGGDLPTPELPLVEETITLKVLYMRYSEHGDFENMWFLDQVEKDTGIRLEIIPVEQAAWTEKMNLAFASGDLPDLFLRGLSSSDAAKYGMGGMLLPLNELIEEYAPNAKHLLNTIPNGVRNVTASDGNIYYMPAYNLTVRDLIKNSGSINTAWIEQLGMETPKTLDDLYEVLKAIRDNDVDGDGDPTNEIPLSYVFNMDAIDATTPILTAFGYVNHRHDVVDGQYVYVPMQNNYREYLRYMNKLWEENLLDHEIFTQTSDQYTSKCKAYTVGMLSSGIANQLFLEHEKKIAYSLVSPLTSEFNQTMCWPAAQCETATNTASFAITSKCEHPEAAVKLLNYFYSDYCSTLTKCGPEKGQWEGEGGWTKLVADDGSVSFTIDFDGEKFFSFSHFRHQNGLMQMPFCYGTNQASIVLSADEYATRVSQMIFDSGRYDASREGFPAGVAFTEDEQDELAMFVLLDSQVDLWCSQFINGEKDIDDDTAWNEYLAMIDSMDVATMIEIRQGAYDRWARN